MIKTIEPHQKQHSYPLECLLHDRTMKGSDVYFQCHLLCVFIHQNPITQKETK